MLDDAELLRRFAEEDEEEAFAELVRRRIDFVYAVALRMVRGNSHLAEDVAQVVFTDLARKAAVLSRRPLLAGWLHTATRFTVGKMLRAENRRHAREQELYAMSETPDEGMAPADWAHVRPVLDEMLGELKEREREAVLLRFFEGRAFAEIGVKLALTETAARSCVDRALEKLHGGLERRGVTSTTAALAVALGTQAGIAAPAGLAASVTGVALAGGSLAGTTTMLSVLKFMSASKTASGVAAFLIIVTAGAVMYEISRTWRLEASLASTIRQRDDLQVKLGRVAQQLATEAKRASEAEEDNALLLKATERLSAIGAAKHSTESGPLSFERVSARYRNAFDLVRRGDFETALKDYLWCFDDGMARVPTFRVARRRALLDAIAALGERYPEALTALRERREQAEKTMLGSSWELEAVADFSALNRVLKDVNRTLTQFDQLPAGDPRREAMASAAFDQLITAQRYTDAAQAMSFVKMNSELERLSKDRPIAVNNPNADEIRKNTREFAVSTTLDNIEVLVGAGDLANGRTLVEKLLTYDGSEITKAAVRARLARAGTSGIAR